MHYDSRSAAALGWASSSAEVSKLQESAPSRATVETNRAKWQDKSFADVASTCGDTAQDEDDDEDDMGVFSCKRPHRAQLPGTEPAKRLRRSLEDGPQQLAVQGQQQLPRADLVSNYGGSCSPEEQAPPASRSDRSPSPAPEQDEEPPAPAKARHPKGRSKGRKGAGANGGRNNAAAPPPKEVKALARTRQSLDSKKEAFSDEQLWRVKIKGRTIDAGLKSLDAAASNLLGSVVEGAEELVSAIGNFQDATRKKHALFCKMRHEGLQWLSRDIDEEDCDLLHILAPPLQAEIFLHFAKEGLKALDKDCCAEHA